MLMKRFGLGIGTFALVAACGGSTDDGLSGSGGAPAGGGTGGASASGGAAGSASGGAAGSASGGVAGVTSSGGTGAGGGGYSLDDVCAKVSPKTCDFSKDCCVASGFGFDQKGCETSALTGCELNVAEVKAGTMSFDPTKIDACLKAYETLFAQCVIDLGDFFAALDQLKSCSFAFEGQLPEGSSCNRDAQCAPSADPNVFTSCDENTKKCTSARRLQLNENCAVGDGVKDFCSPGLYCDAAFVGLPPYPGICKPATPEGAKCNAFKPFNLECGAGFYCNKATSSCTKAKVGGANCAEALECQSFVCALGKCTALEPLVSQASCTG